MAESPNKAERDWKRETREWMKALLPALAIVLVIRMFFFTPAVVSGSSMEPNLSDGERVIVNKVVYSTRAPERGEVIVFHADDNKDYIKRVIAVPGDRIMVRQDEVYINGSLIAEPYIQEQVEAARRSGTSYNRLKNFRVTEFGIEPATVPEGHYFVMGDNRSNSTDSRDPQIGFVPEHRIVGRVEYVFWPLPDIRRVRHPAVQIAHSEVTP